MQAVEAGAAWAGHVAIPDAEQARGDQDARSTLAPKEQQAISELITIGAVKDAPTTLARLACGSGA